MVDIIESFENYTPVKDVNNFTQATTLSRKMSGNYTPLKNGKLVAENVLASIDSLEEIARNEGEQQARPNASNFHRTNHCCSSANRKDKISRSTIVHSAITNVMPNLHVVHVVKVKMKNILKKLKDKNNLTIFFCTLGISLTAVYIGTDHLTLCFIICMILLGYISVAISTKVFNYMQAKNTYFREDLRQELPAILTYYQSLHQAKKGRDSISVPTRISSCRHKQHDICSRGIGVKSRRIKNILSRQRAKVDSDDFKVDLASKTYQNNIRIIRNNSLLEKEMSVTRLTSVVKAATSMSTRTNDQTPKAKAAIVMKKFKNLIVNSPRKSRSSKSDKQHEQNEIRLSDISRSSAIRNSQLRCPSKSVVDKMGIGGDVSHLEKTDRIHII